MKKIKISAVSYLNTTPFMYGIENSIELGEKIDLSKDIPSECARKLLNNDVDLGLIPVAVIPQLKEYHIVSNFCIGAKGKVHTVLLLSDVPLDEIDTVLLDYQSRTSVALCKILCEEFWKITPNFAPAKPGYEKSIGGNTAAVIIGDRTFNLDKNYAYRFDLSEEWLKLTGLPFVFAAWVSNKKLSQEFIQTFKKELEYGLIHLNESVEKSQQNKISKAELKEYLTEYIQFDLDEEKRKGMELFLSKL